MVQRIEVPGQGIVEFPDDMTDDQIVSAIQANVGQAAQPAAPAPAAPNGMIPGSRFEPGPSLGEPGYRPPGPSLRGPTLGDYAAATKHIAASIAAAVPAGAIGIYELARTQSTEKAANAITDIQNALATQLAGEPKTLEEAVALERVGKAAEGMAQIPQAVGGFVLEKTGSPALATAADILTDPFALATGGAAVGVRATGAGVRGVVNRIPDAIKRARYTRERKQHVPELLLNKLEAETRPTPSESQWNTQVRRVNDDDLATAMSGLEADIASGAYKGQEPTLIARYADLALEKEKRDISKELTAASVLAQGKPLSSAAQGMDEAISRPSQAYKETYQRFYDKIDTEVWKAVNSGRTPESAISTVRGKLQQTAASMPYHNVSDADLTKLLGTVTAAQQRAVGEGAIAALRQSADKVLGAVSTRLFNINEKVGFAFRANEQAKLERSSYWHQQLATMKDVAKRTLSKEDYALFKDRALQGFDELQRFVETRGSQDLRDHMQFTLRPLFDETAKDLAKVDPDFAARQNYFTRLVKDYDGLLKAVDSKKRNIITAAVAKAEARQGRKLLPEERSEIINGVLRIAPQKKTSLSGYTNSTKARAFDQVPEELKKFYHDPFDALDIYVRTTTNKIENSKFFGQYSKEGEGAVAGSIGQIIDEELKAGRLTYKDVETIDDIFKARLVEGEQAAPTYQQIGKNLWYGMLLGQVTSAIKQVGDVATSVHMNGITPTITSIAKTLTGRKQLGPEDLGIRHIAADLESTHATAKALESVLKYSGFNKVDMFGKTVFVNAAMKRRSKQLGTAKGMQEFVAQYKNAFADNVEMAQAIRDLRAQRVTPLSKTVLFNDLLDVQPVAKSEWTEFQLKHPHARMFYSLKTWTLKMLDLQRREMMKEVKRGNVAKGTYNLAKLSTTLALANAGVEEINNFLLGRETDFEDQVVSNLWKNVGTSEYIGQQVADGKVSKAVASLIAPPAGVFDNPATDIVNVAKAIYSMDSSLLTFKTAQNLPVAGKFLHNWFGGGLEEWQAKQDKKAAQEEREVEKQVWGE